MKNVWVRLGVHYLTVILLFAGLARLFPSLIQYVAAEKLRTAESVSVGMVGAASGESGQAVQVGVAQLMNPAATFPVLLSLVGALLLTLPVAWVYQWTTDRKQYSQDFVRTLLVIPIAIALVVFLVKGSLALAFSLAGIVAAIRFRASLSGAMDGVYMFIVIGIGLAVGVQLAAVAILASVIFNVVMLSVWRLDFGAQPAVLSGWTLVAAEDAGDEPQTNGPCDFLLRIEAKNAHDVQKSTSQLLDEKAKKWQLSRVLKNSNGTSTLEFNVRLKRSMDPAGFMSDAEKVKGVIGKAELIRKKTR